MVSTIAYKLEREEMNVEAAGTSRNRKYPKMKVILKKALKY